MIDRVGVIVLGLTFAAGCRARVAAPVEQSGDPAPSETETETETMSNDELSAWEGRCVIAQGYALGQKIGPLLDRGGPTIGVVFDDGGDWPVPLGSRVRVQGRIAKRSDLPVFVPDPDEPIVQGMPVPPGTDLEQARQRHVIEHPQVTALRSFAEVEAELEARVGETVALPGIVWSRNGFWWFSHDGVDVHLDGADELGFEDHGAARVVHGELRRDRRPRIDQLGIHDQPERVESFVVRVSSFSPHPGWALEPCPDPS